jgi:hypothetical protein
MKKLLIVLPLLIICGLMLSIWGCSNDEGVNTPTSSAPVANVGSTKNYDAPRLSCTCTRTPGYWKTHPNDEAWGWIPGGLGVNTILVGTGKTYMEILWTVPRHGDAFYILAHQWIAARMNRIAGASPDPVLDLSWYAYDLLDAYDGNPHMMSEIKGAVREDFINTAAILDQYNNGIIGPGHCPD